MASPFRLFRKHVKPLLAVFVVLLMLSWVVGDSLVSYMGARVPGEDPRQGAQAPTAVAVKWDGGQLTNNEVGNLVRRRQLANHFLEAVEMFGARAMMDAGMEPQPLRVDVLRGPQTHQEGVEQHVVYTKLVADLARKAGMRVSDDAIATYLDELGRRRVSRDDMKALIKQMNSTGGHVSTAYIFDALRDEMLAHNLLASYQFSLETVTPEERWKDWLRSNDRIVLEAAAFPAEDLLLDVPEPTDEELQAFVQPPDNPKVNLLERDPQPDFFVGGLELPSRHPGFAVPRKIDVQFVEANYDKFLAKVEEEITDQEIAEYYEAKKDPLYIQLDTRLIDDQKGTSEPAKNDDAGAAEDTGKTDEPSPPAAETQQPPATESQQPPAAGREGAAQPDGKSSSHRDAARSPFRLTAFLQESADSKAAETPPAAATEAPAKTPPESSAPNTSTPPLTAPATTDAATSPADPSAKPAEQAPKKFQPLEEVRDEIRRQIASERVAAQLIELMKKLDGEVNAEFTKYFSESLNARADEKGPPPPTGVLADLKPLADANGLTYGKTGPLSALEMRKTPVGESIDDTSPAQLFQLLFGTKDLDMYQPKLTHDFLGNRFLAMKTSDTPRRIPELKDVKPDVVRAWKLQKAGEKALQRAEEVAKKVGETGSSLTDYFADDKSTKVISTDPFSWQTGGEVSMFDRQQRPLRLSAPEGIVAAGPDFMKYVFSLDEGKPGAVLNHDHSIAYVVRVAEHEQSPETLRASYLAEANNWPGFGSMIGEHVRDATRQMITDMTEPLNLKWERPADAVDEEQ